MPSAFLVTVFESETERILTMENEEKTLEFVSKVVSRQHPGTILSIHKADTTTGTLVEYESVLNGYQLELREK